jgi:hypothetical protein
MTIRNPTQQPLQDADLDRALDAALAKYSAAEPRVGLEDRVFASIRTAQADSPKPAWWAWGLAAATAMIVIAVALTLRPDRKSKPAIAGQTPVARQSARTDTEVAKRDATAVLQRAPIGRKHKNPAVIAAASAPVPKLDQFPSPQPLSEEEKILAGYIEQNPKHAALLAEARMDFLRLEAEERLRMESKDQPNTQ